MGQGGVIRIRENVPQRPRRRFMRIDVAVRIDDGDFVDFGKKRFFEIGHAILIFHTAILSKFRIYSAHETHETNKITFLNVFSKFSDFYRSARSSAERRRRIAAGLPAYGSRNRSVCQGSSLPRAFAYRTIPNK